jgi:hypothetical protein
MKNETKTMDDLKRMTINLKRQGKTNAQIKQMISAYLGESKKKLQSTGL